MPTKAERLAEFVTRLAAAPRARSFDEAYGQICRIMNEVEDDLSGVPYNLAASPRDGRMYPPLWDNVFRVTGRAGVWRLRSLAHVTFVGDNGSIEVQDFRTGRPIFQKPGDDGRQVGDL